MPDVGLEKFRIFIFILYPMLTVSNYSGVGKSHPRRGLFNSFGSRSGKVNYRWDLLDINFVFLELKVGQCDKMTQWQNDKMTKGRPDKKRQDKQNWSLNDSFYYWHWKRKGSEEIVYVQKSSTVQKLVSNQPKIFMRYLNVDRFSGRRRKKSWITWWERRYTTLGSVPRESIKLVYMCAKTTMELNWIEINMMKTTKPKHSIETGIYLYKFKDNHETMEWNWN